MTITKILAKAGMNTVLGMGTVFFVLIFISGIISLFRYLPDKKKVAAESRSAAADSETAVSQEEDDEELIAVITAAVTAYCAADGIGSGESGESGGESGESPYIVRSIRRIGK